jgi:hypothetical protein
VIGEVSFVNSDLVTTVAIASAIAAIVLAVVVLFLTRRRKNDVSKELPELTTSPSVLPFETEHSVTSFDAQKSKKELRLLDVEQEILSYGIRRLYEAQAEGKLTDKEREQLAENYKQRMREVKNAIDENESVVALHELEGMQENLIKLFNDRFDEINKKIGGIKTNLGIKPQPVAPKPAPEEPSTVSRSAEKTTRKRRKRSKPKKTEAEERIDQIRSEVEKVLERLGQMETEA